LAHDPEVLMERFLAVSRAIAGQLDFQSVLGQIAGEVYSLFQHDHMDVAIIPPDRTDCCVAFEVGVSTKWGENSDDPRPIAESPIRDLLSGKVSHIVTADAWTDERFHFDKAFDAPIFDANLHSRIHVPLQVHGVVHGALNISSHQKNKYSEDDVQTARQIADLLAPYFFALIHSDEARKLALAEGAARGSEEALRLGALRLTEGMENERRRLGMDLHDQTLADLARIHRNVLRINRKGNASEQDLAPLVEQISGCMQELRRIIEDTKPGILDLFGFAHAVEAQLERSVEGLVPPVKTQVNDKAAWMLDQGPDSMRTALFRIVQEAINNAAKHSDPTNLSVLIDADNNNLQISITDDGSGELPDPGSYSGGLDNMRIRAALVSARVEIVGGVPEGGTRVTISIPQSVLSVETPARKTSGQQSSNAA
jgi:signal transduction histidine kinase